MNWLKKLGMPSTLSLQRTCLYSPGFFFFLVQNTLGLLRIPSTFLPS